MEKIPLHDIGLMYDRQFNQKMKIAKFLLKYLRDRKDVDIATKWLVRVGNIKSPLLEVKKNRNEFLTYLLKVLRDGALRSCINAENTVCDPDDSLGFLDWDETSTISTEVDTSRKQFPDEKVKINFHSKWSADHKVYIAVKPLPGRGALVYLAVSKKPGLEHWDIPKSHKDTIEQ